MPYVWKLSTWTREEGDDMTFDFEQDLGVLDRRPEARAFKVEDLLTEVRLGRIRIPAFQRALKWEREDARKLIDSIYRGFPIGTLLLWETRADAATLTFGTVIVHADARENALWVVDGQQRIVSLIRTLLAPEPAKDDFALYFDLDEGQFVSPPARQRLEQDESRWLPVASVLDSEHLFQWLLSRVSSSARRDRAIQLGKRIREYDIPAYIVRTDSEEALREVFGRINNLGKRLEAAEVFDALYGARTAQRPSSLVQIVQELEELEFGRVEEKILYRLLRVLTGADVSDRSGEGVLRLSGEAATEAYALTSKVAREVILFIKRDVGIAHYDLLPYKQPLVTLGKFFQHHASPTPRSRELLVRWLWRGALTGSHRGDTVSTRRSLDQIDPSSEDASVQRMIHQVSSSVGPFPTIQEPFNFRHASSKLQVLALLDLKPRDLHSGEIISIVDLLNARQSEDDLPVAAIFSADATTGSSSLLVRGIANKLVHPRTPGIRRLFQFASEGVLTSHAIDPSWLTHLMEGDGDSFLRLRSIALKRHFEAFFSRRARWGESDRPTLKSLVVEDD